jgi:hypothetical protein
MKPFLNIGLAKGSKIRAGIFKGHRSRRFEFTAFDPEAAKGPVMDAYTSTMIAELEFERRIPQQQTL